MFSLTVPSTLSSSVSLTSWATRERKSLISPTSAVSPFHHPLVGTSKVAQRAKEGNPDHLIPRKRASLQGMQPHTAMLPSQSLSIRAPHSPCHLHLHPLTPRSSHHEGMQLPQRKRRNKNSCNDHRRRKINSFLLPSDPIFIPVIYLES